jgi:hypothetical protein
MKKLSTQPIWHITKNEKQNVTFLFSFSFLDFYIQYTYER